MSARLDAFDIPPWREIWGVDRDQRRVVRLSSEGALVEVLPAVDVNPSAVAISP